MTRKILKFGAALLLIGITVLLESCSEEKLALNDETKTTNGKSEEIYTNIPVFAAEKLSEIKVDKIEFEDQSLLLIFDDYKIAEIIEMSIVYEDGSADFPVSISFSGGNLADFVSSVIKKCNCVMVRSEYAVIVRRLDEGTMVPDKL